MANVREIAERISVRKNVEKFEKNLQTSRKCDQICPKCKKCQEYVDTLNDSSRLTGPDCIRICLSAIGNSLSGVDFGWKNVENMARKYETIIVHVTWGKKISRKCQNHQEHIEKKEKYCWICWKKDEIILTQKNGKYQKKK